MRHFSNFSLPGDHRVRVKIPILTQQARRPDVRGLLQNDNVGTLFKKIWSKAIQDVGRRAWGPSEHGALRDCTKLAQESTFPMNPRRANNADPRTHSEDPVAALGKH